MSAFFFFFCCLFSFLTFDFLRWSQNIESGMTLQHFSNIVYGCMCNTLGNLLFIYSLLLTIKEKEGENIIVNLLVLLLVWRSLLTGWVARSFERIARSIRSCAVHPFRRHHEYTRAPGLSKYGDTSNIFIFFFVSFSLFFGQVLNSVPAAQTEMIQV